MFEIINSIVSLDNRQIINHTFGLVTRLYLIKQLKKQSYIKILRGLCKEKSSDL